MPRKDTAMTTSPNSTTTPTIDNNALTASLRALKLGGMLQTLDARLAQARAGELGHLEFLQVLCHDEISRRETTAIHRRTRRARFEQTLTLEGFDFAAAPKLPAAQIRDLAALRWLQAGESIIFYGPVEAG
jgi:DNA replication protein DnaC